MLKRVFVILLVCMFVMSMLAVSASADEGGCSITANSNLKSITALRGGSTRIELSDVFSDSEGHQLTYSIDEADESLHARVSEDGILKLDPLMSGDFKLSITASCSEGQKLKITVPVDVDKSPDTGNPAQYGYDETPADSVSVYVTLSSDGVPLVGNDQDNTVMAGLKVTVPYFDLGLYGLERYYRYHTKDGKGDYVDEEVVERPTAMHMFIYITERYYMGIPEDKCCKGTSHILEYDTPCTVRNMLGKTAYEADKHAYMLSGSPTSSFMDELWGHSSNLMYYRNHFFPLMDNGWGSTADYQLLSDGDTMDIGMFTDLQFYATGAFCCFDQLDYTAETGKPVGFITMAASSSALGSGSLSPIEDLEFQVYDSEWDKAGSAESDSAVFEYTFNEPGDYYVVGFGKNKGSQTADKAPAVSAVHVTDSFADCPFEKITDDKNRILPFIDQQEIVPGIVNYHVKVPSDTQQVNIYWNEIKDTECSGKYLDLRMLEVGNEENCFINDEEKISTDPGKWDPEERAMVISDGDDIICTFTFESYTPEGYNFAPQFVFGHRDNESITVREHKKHTFKMSDYFYDPDGDDMTYIVSADGGDPTPFNDEYVLETSETGNIKLVFSATDSAGNKSDDLHINVNVESNIVPELVDSSNSSKEVMLRYDESTSIDLLTVFEDMNDDTIDFYISTDGGEYEKAQLEHKYDYWWDESMQMRTVECMIFKYAPESESYRGTHIYRFKAADDLGTGKDIYTLTVNIVDNRAPVPEKEELTEYCMMNHYYFFDPQEFFKDPEGDKILRYQVSVNGGPLENCRRLFHNSSGNTHPVLINKDETYTITFYAEDKYGASGSCTVHVYPVPEVIHEIEISKNYFSGQETGPVLYDDLNGDAPTCIKGYEVSRNVTLRSVSYSEYEGDYNYYLDIDGYHVSPDDTFSLIVDGDVNIDRVSNNWGGETQKSIDFDACANDVMAKVAFYRNINDGSGRRKSIYHIYRITTHITDPGAVEPEKLEFEWVDDAVKDQFYAGELLSGFAVKCRFSDGIARYLNDYTLNRENFETAGKNTLTAAALGLSCSSDLTINAVPGYMAVINDKGKYGRVRLAEVVDDNGAPVQEAELSIADPVTDPGYDESKYDGDFYGNYPDMLRNTYEVEIRLPMSYQGEKVALKLDARKDRNDAAEYFSGNTVSNDEQYDRTIGIASFKLSDGKAIDQVKWYDRIGGLRSWWHSYDLFNVTVKTGSCEVIGKVSSWDEKDNAEFLAYPDSMTEEEVRSDAMGERAKLLPTSSTVEEVVENGSRYEQAFKVEGLDAGTYKLAVVKPGKYVAKVVKAEIDGTDDVGTLDLRLFGDVNNDGKVRAGDAAQIARYIVGNRDMTDEEFLAADVTLDGKVRAGDAAQIARYIVGKSSSLDEIK